MTLTSAAQPDVDPSAILFSSWGLITGPVNDVQLVTVKHHSSHTALSVIVPPASNILDTSCIIIWDVAFQQMWPAHHGYSCYRNGILHGYGLFKKFSTWCTNYVTSPVPAVRKLTFDLCIMQLNFQDTYISPRHTTQRKVSATIHFVSPYVGFHAMDSGFFVTETVVTRTLDSLSCIPNSKAQDSRLYSKNALIQDSTSKNFRILESGLMSPTWSDLYDMRTF